MEHITKLKMTPLLFEVQLSRGILYLYFHTLAMLNRGRVASVSAVSTMRLRWSEKRAGAKLEDVRAGGRFQLASDESLF